MTDNDFDRYVGMYRSSVTRAALCILRDAEEAEDIAQEVFLRLYTYEGSFAGDEHVKAWLLRCTVNRSRGAGEPCPAKSIAEHRRSALVQTEKCCFTFRYR